MEFPICTTYKVFSIAVYKATFHDTQHKLKEKLIANKVVVEEYKVKVKEVKEL